MLGSLRDKAAGSVEAGKGVEAIAVWEVAPVTASPSDRAPQLQQDRQQGIVQKAPITAQSQQGSSSQPSGSAHLQLVGYHSLMSQADVVHVLASTETSARLILGSSNGKMHHVGLDWSRSSLSIDSTGALNDNGTPCSGTAFKVPSGTPMTSHE